MQAEGHGFHLSTEHLEGVESLWLLGPGAGRRANQDSSHTPGTPREPGEGCPRSQGPKGGSLRAYEVWFSSLPAKLLLHFLHILTGFMFSLREFCTFQAWKGITVCWRLCPLCSCELLQGRSRAVSLVPQSHPPLPVPNAGWSQQVDSVCV